MRRQRNMAQMKEQIKPPEKELNKMEIATYQMWSSKLWLLRCSRNLVIFILQQYKKDPVRNKAFIN